MTHDQFVLVCDFIALKRVFGARGQASRQAAGGFVCVCGLVWVDVW